MASYGSIEYDTVNKRAEWFKLRNITYRLRDSIVINGENSEMFYGLIAEIKRNNKIKVQWYYLQHEMVMSKSEKASVHDNEIFITDSTDIIDVETIQMKAAIFHTKGFAPPKKIPGQWMILRRKYNPFTNSITSINITRDRLHRIDKLNVSLCSKSSDSDPGSDGKAHATTPSIKTPNKSTDVQKQSKSETKGCRLFFSSSDDNEKSDPELKKQSESKLPAKSNESNTKSSTLNASGKSHLFFLSSEDMEVAPAIDKSSQKSVKPMPATPLKSILKPTPKSRKKVYPKTVSTITGPEQTPNRTRSGRNIKPVENFHSLERSLAIEALMKSKLVKAEESGSTDSDSDQAKENRSPKNKPKPVRKNNAKIKKKRLYRKHSDSSISHSDSADENYDLKKKKKKTPRTPLAPKNRKLTLTNTPCVVPLRASGQGKETSFTVARSRLHVSAVPETLPCREEQFSDIYYFLESKLEEQSGGCMYISGVPGTGKTATVRDVLRHIGDGEYDYQMIEVNGMKLSDPKQLYSLIYKHLEGRKVTPDHGNLLLSEYFGKNEKKSIVLVVDELDLLWTRKQHVMYNLFDWPNRANSKLVVIAIANTMDLPERMLMNKVASRLGLTRMTFQPYSHKQLLEIINSRLEGTTAFAPEACMLAARKVAAASGDARRALDICRHAIELAEQANASTVSSSHIQQSITDMYQSVKSRAIMNCTLYQKIFLKSVLGVFRRKGVEEAVFKEVYEVFSSLCQFQGLFSPSCSAILQLCMELGGCRILLIEQGPPSLHTHIRLNSSQDDVVFALKESG